MATLASSHREHVGAHAVAAWTPQAALRYAWFAYLALLVIPAILLLYTVWSNDHAGEGVGDRDLATRWFIACVAYVVVVVPASFFVRSRFFRAYWTAGQCVSPRNYFMGMMVTWVALEVAGLLSITGCLVTRTFAPCILPAVVAFMTFVALWPSGRAMVCRDRGESDDPEKYEEPR
jgi:hypothetical protein